MLIAVSTLAVLFVIMVLAASPRLAGRFAEHENWMRYVGIVHIGVDRLRRDPRDAPAALFAAIAYQVTVLRAVYCAVHVIGLRIPNGARPRVRPRGRDRAGAPDQRRRPRRP